MRAGAHQHSAAQTSAALTSAAQTGADQRAHLEVVRQSVTTAATLAHERTLPVAEGLAAVVPSGQLQRGSTLSVHGVGATSFALALAGQVVRDGSFLAVVAPNSFSLAACIDFDIPLRRVVQFVLPSTTTPQAHAQAVAAIIEGFDVVMLADGRRVGSSPARQLVARNRERGSLLVRVGGAAWPDAADLRFDLGSPEWSGLGQGHGHLRARQVSVQVAGRRHHGAARGHQLLLPALDGGVELAQAPVAQPMRVAVGGGLARGGVAAGRAQFAGSDIDAFLDAVSDAKGAAESEVGLGEIA